MPAYSPSEAQAHHKSGIPEEVFTVVNELLSEPGDKSRIVVHQIEVVSRLLTLGITEVEALKRGWLDIEEDYRDKGWSVTYDKPGYNEAYGPRWIFKATKA